MLFKWLLFVPSFIDFSVGSLTSDDSKTGVNFQPPFPTRGTTSLRNRRDRRMTHWESQSHSNFDGEDNRDREQISFPSILQEPSLLHQTPINIKIAEKYSSPDLEVTRNMLTGPLSTFEGCIVDVFPLRSVVSWLLFSGGKYNPGIARNGPLRVGNIMVPRCEEGTMQNRRIQEPVYAEEPGWIVIELNSYNLGSRDSNSQREPFYVARGKRSLQKSMGESSKEGKTKNPEAGELDLPISSDLSHQFRNSFHSMRKKRDAFGENLQKYVREGGAGRLISSQFAERSRENAYVQPRIKNSDIFEILNEPFFISRGKKNSMTIQRSELNNGYSRPLLNFEMKRRFLDAWQPNKTKRDCDPSTASNCSQLELKMNKPSNGPFRDRRGVVEELLKDADPFYLSRGKRSLDTTQEYNSSSELKEPAEIINKNLSIDVQH